MHATLRRYECVNQARPDELTDKGNNTLTTRLSEPGRVQRSLPVRGRRRRHAFGQPLQTTAEADESTRLVREWMREQGLEAALPNPTITSGRTGWCAITGPAAAV
jgi:hypothetical protein